MSASPLLFVLSWSAFAAVATSDGANVQEAPIGEPPPEAGAPSQPAAAPALPPPTPPTPTPPPLEPPARPSSPPAIHGFARLRVAGRYYSVNGGPNGSAVDSTFGEFGASSQIHKNVSVALSFYSSGDGSISLENAIVGLDFVDAIHLWIGQMLVPTDRSNLGGPFSAIAWNFYPGLLAYGAGTRVVALPRQNSVGRDGGAALWGDLGDKKLHYALGIFLPRASMLNGAPAAQTPLVSGRLGIAILGNESGYTSRSTYFGDRDIVAVGIDGQFQKDGSIGVAPPNAMGVPAGVAPATDNYAELNSDLLVEMRYAGGGYFTLAGAYYRYFGNNEPIKDEVSIFGAIATPRLGVGQLQPYGRWQWFSPTPSSVEFKTFAVDAGVNYLVMGPALRFMLAFQHVDLGNDQRSNVVQLGAQASVF